MSQCKNLAKLKNSREHDLKLKLKNCLVFLNNTSRYIFFSIWKGIGSWKAKQKLMVSTLGFEVTPLGWTRCFWERKFRRRYRWDRLTSWKSGCVCHLSPSHPTRCPLTAGVVWSAVLFTPNYVWFWQTLFLKCFRITLRSLMIGMVLFWRTMPFFLTFDSSKL